MTQNEAPFRIFFPLEAMVFRLKASAEKYQKE